MYPYAYIVCDDNNHRVRLIPYDVSGVLNDSTKRIRGCSIRGKTST